MDTIYKEDIATESLHSCEHKRKVNSVVQPKEERIQFTETQRDCVPLLDVPFGELPLYVNDNRKRNPYTSKVNDNEGQGKP